MPYYSIVMVSIGSLSTGSPSVSSFSSGECSNAILQHCYGFKIGSPSTGSPSLSTFSSGECGNAILQYCYGFNRLSGLVQGLLHSVPSLQVSVAMPYYSIVMVSIGSSSGS